MIVNLLNNILFILVVFLFFYGLYYSPFDFDCKLTFIIIIIMILFIVNKLHVTQNEHDDKILNEIEKEINYESENSQ